MTSGRNVVYLLVTALAPSFLGAQVSVTDDLGIAVSLSRPARRIVSLAPSLTEELFAVGAGTQVVGVTTLCDYPPATQHIARVGGMVNPSLESIVSLLPDLIVVSMEGNTREDYHRLTSLKIPVYVTNPRTLSGIYRNLTHLGILTGHGIEAQALVDSLTRREQELRARAEGKSVSALFCVSLQPLIVAGRNTLLHELMTLAGARNIAGGMRGNYPAISREAVLAENPDVLLLTADLIRQPGDLLKLFPEWSQLRAVRANRVFRLDPDILSRPGPRALEGLALLTDSLHREEP